MGRIKSLIVTLVIMGLVWWVFALTDAYAWGIHQVLAGILEVAGMIGFGLIFYVFLRLSDSDLKMLSGKRRKESWEAGWSGEWQR